MSDLQARFETAAQEAQELPSRPDNATMLKLYALYKQGTIGDVAGNQPNALDFIARAKYDSWAKLKGTTKEAAMQSYIELVESLQKSMS